MINIYVKMILAGRRTFSSVLEKDKAAVKEELLKRIKNGSLTADQYNDIMSK